jgi:hypothetical protein
MQSTQMTPTPRGGEGKCESNKESKNQRKAKKGRIEEERRANKKRKRRSGAGLRERPVVPDGSRGREHGRNEPTARRTSWQRYKIISP